MTLRAALTIALALLCTASSSRASEEDHMRWQSVQLDCFETPDTGKVRVSATSDEHSIQSLTITAFGKDYALTQPDLLKIKEFPLDSLRVTHEAGYAKTGGHTVHARFSRPSETAYVSVSKDKGLFVSAQLKQPKRTAHKTATMDESRSSQQLYLGGVLYYQKGDYEKARKQWQDALAMDPSNSDAKAGLERIALLYGKPKTKR